MTIQQHPALDPQPPIEEPPRRREGVLLGLAALLGAIVVVGGLLAVQRTLADEDDAVVTATPADTDTVAEEDEDPDPVPEDAPDAEQAPAPEVAPELDEGQVPDTEEAVELAICPTSYEQVICDAAAFVQQTRGRPFKNFPSVELLPDEEFDLALLDDFDTYQDELRQDERVLKALGLVPTALDLVETFRDLLESGVVGFYDPDTERLVVRGGEFDLYSQLVLVHELVHAFDDQWFDLSRDDFTSEDAEYGYVAVIEGSASWVESLWRNQLSAEDEALLTRQELATLSPEDLEKILAMPQVLLALQASPYVDGERYVGGLITDDGQVALDEALAEPPVSSEIVLHPDRDAADLAVIELDTPPADGSVIEDGVLGELVILQWLGATAATGWGGDRYVVSVSGPQTCLVVDLAADGPTDLIEMESAIDGWVDEASDLRSLETVSTADRSILRVTGCY
ncbi:MAG: hypothetical protein AAF547_19935 [Actinomycetota bacterium]